MTTPQIAASGVAAAAPGNAVVEPPAIAPRRTDDPAPTSATLTGTDVASVVTVNEARSGMGLGPLTVMGGAEDPDGYLTVSEFKAKRQALGGAQGAAEGAEAAAETPPATEQKSLGMLRSLQELLALRKALELVDQDSAERAFAAAKALEAE